MIQKLLQVFKHGGGLWLIRKIVANRGIRAVERAQFVHPVRVWQAARIEHKVRIARHPAPVGEGL